MCVLNLCVADLLCPCANTSRPCSEWLQAAAADADAVRLLAFMLARLVGGPFTRVLSCLATEMCDIMTTHTQLLLQFVTHSVI
jgi:hypothetical protein